MIKYETNSDTNEYKFVYLPIDVAQYQGYMYDIDYTTYYVAKDNLLLFLMHSYAHFMHKKINDSDEYTIAEHYVINSKELLKKLESINGITLIENYLNNYLNIDKYENEYDYEY